ncbi:DUF3710 domain-containing protein, partial [Brachybacterium sp. AOP43-C2-M15]|uniref:DUF3710 domain-containing protein n=1 Tax=Brachybacterium sp. AOP43-C2-M15 TaxID=3457661 RepID=UPI0040346866
MGLFSRKKKQAEEDAVLTASEETTEDPTSADGAAPDEEADSADDAEDQDAPEEAATAEDPDAPAENVRETPRTEHLEDGPYDEADAPEEDRIDLGGLQVPTIDGLELRMVADQRSGGITGANLVIAGSSLQVQAFAAPKSRGLWEEVRTSLRDSVVSQGGTAETRTGVFGTELITRLPVKRADGRTGYRPARFIGIDGRRWFLRAILTGKALGDAEQSRRFETILSRLVVVRGSEAMAPQELIPLHVPGERPGL